jgi:hypothetical protein
LIKSLLNVSVVTLGKGGWYPKGVERLIRTMSEHSPEFSVTAWVGDFPAGAPEEVVVRGVDYGAYCAKPFALKSVMDTGADIGIFCDASYFNIRNISPLVEWISATGHYFMLSGNQVGNWVSDACLEKLGQDREELFGVRELASGCVGLDFNRKTNWTLVQQWCECAKDGVSFPGPHSAGRQGRNPGFVSSDPRVLGHRHDQSVLNVLAHRLGIRMPEDPPRFSDYSYSRTEKSVLLSEGM